MKCLNNFKIQINKVISLIIIVITTNVLSQKTTTEPITTTVEVLTTDLLDRVYDPKPLPRTTPHDPIIDIREILKTTTEIPVKNSVETDEDILQKLYSFINDRLLLAIHEARYKWKHGIAISLTKDRYDEIMTSAEKQANYFNIDVNDAKQFVMDQIEACTVTECAVTSNWYANMGSIDQFLPETKVPIEEPRIHSAIERAQNETLKIFSLISDIRLDRKCNKFIGKQIFENRFASNNDLLRIALQISMGNFCKLYLHHESPYKTRIPTTRRRGTTKRINYRRMYRRTQKVYTPPPVNRTTTIDPVEVYEESFYKGIQKHNKEAPDITPDTSKDDVSSSSSS